MYKKLTITTFIFLILTISVSFAWMIDMMGPSGHIVTFHYDNEIHISPNNLQIEISTFQNGVYVPLYSTDNEKNVLALFENSAPGDVIRFRVKIKNLTENTISTSVVFSDISSDLDDFYNYISIGIFSTNGFDAKHKAPEIGEFKITERMKKDSNKNVIINEKNSITFIENLDVPPSGQEIEIKFYVRFDSIRESQNQLQGKIFTIGKINFMCI